MAAYSAPGQEQVVQQSLAVAGTTGAEDEPVACTWENTFGGQAVIEGVMMRGKYSWGLAVRRPSGSIARSAYPLQSLGSRYRWLRLPVVRGVISLYESLSLGVKALGMSANIGLEDPGTAESPASNGHPVIDGDPVADGDSVADEATASAKEGELPERPPAFGWKELAVTVVVAVGFAVALFIVIPLFVVKMFEETFANPFVFNLVEGVIRIVIFILYIVVVSFIPDLRRVFMYHGAEHKVIHAYESCGRPDAGKAVGFSTRHPRCGTGFLLIVMVIAVFVFAIVGKPSLPWLVLSRIVGIPLIIGVSYEIGIKWLGKHPDGFIARFLLWPGLQLQRLTTREPTPDQLEVAAAALEETMRMDEIEYSALAEAASRT
ncbi:MAG: DUF1385 domain-containing protein [Thermoleophilia bacterium]|nr:DUF1385 domain-containing protein [Thermoleophilia bacterium]